MATARPPWRVPGAVLFSHGELSYEVDLSREVVEELAHSRLGERAVLAWEFMKGKRTRPVIVRSLPPGSAVDPDALARMRARLSEEARLATYLEDARIARVLGRYAPAFCLYVGAEVASALHHAHTRTDERGAPLGIVHRDVNPARIYLSTAGEVVLTDFARARSRLPGRVETTLPRPEGEVFYCSPERLLGQQTDPRSDLFSLGLVLLELATWRHLYSTANARPGDLAKALTPAARKQVLHAAFNAVGAYESLPDYAEDCILRAATFAPQDVEELARPLAEPLRSIVRRLIQREPEERYPSAAKLEAELRAGLASLGASYGAREALEEVYCSLDGARRSRRVVGPTVVGPTNEEQLPPVFVADEDLITASGGTD